MFLKHTKWAMLWALLIFILCAIPGQDLPHISFLELLAFDKWVHAGIFFVQMLLTSKAFIVQINFVALKNHAKLFSLAICIVYGASLEIMQQLVFDDRTADLYDFIANTFGAVCGYIFYKYFNKFILEKLHRQ
jgi:VanZ family protein